MVRTARSRRNGIVLGGSMGGLLAARALSEHFEHVIILERDPMPDHATARRGQPQTRHLHALLAAGYDHLAVAFPDLRAALEEEGAIVGDAGENMSWFCYGGYRRPIRVGFEGATMSRPFLESLVRQRVRALPNVSILDGCKADGLATDETRSTVHGVRISHRESRRYETLPADLVIDATGRGSSTRRWLHLLGYDAPSEERVDVNVGYASRRYARDPREPRPREWMIVNGTPPQGKRLGYMVPIEGGERIVTLAGIAGDHPPLDEEGFLEFAKSLPTEDLYDLIQRSRPTSDIVPHKFPSSRWWHYERLSRFPNGFLILGDSFASFNPVYGQGMSSAALQAAALDRVLADGHHGSKLATEYFREASSIIDRLWRLAVGEDFRYPETTGRKRPGTALLNAYVLRVHQSTHDDPIVCRAFLKVMHLLAPPISLLKPDIVMRVLRARGATRGRPKGTPPAVGRANEA